MVERCPDCGRPFATTAHEQAYPAWCNGGQSHGCLRSQLATALAKVAELEANNRAVATAAATATARLTADCEARVAKLEAELADVRALDAWLRANKNHQLVTDLGVVCGESVSLLFDDERDTMVHKVEETFPDARRAAVKYLKKEGKDG